MGMCDSGPSPMRVLTVTGSETLSTTMRAIATMAAGSRSQPAPAPRPAIFGHPAPAVDVDEQRLGALGEARGLGEPLGVRAVDLDGGQLVVVRELDLAPGVAAARAAAPRR